MKSLQKEQNSTNLILHSCIYIIPALFFDCKLELVSTNSTVNHRYHKNLVSSIIIQIQNLRLFFIGIKQKNLFFEKKNSKWPTQKKWVFQLHQFWIFFCENFMDCSLSGALKNLSGWSGSMKNLKLLIFVNEKLEVLVVG